jgi:hypothetical protein
LIAIRQGDAQRSGRDPSGGCAVDAADFGVQAQIDAGGAHRVGHRLHHFRVDGGHDLRVALDQGDADFQVMQVFGDLQADEAAADDDRVAHVVALDPLLDLVAVRHRAQREDAGQVDAGNRRHDRLRAGRQHQVIVGDLLAAAVIAADLDGLLPRSMPVTLWPVRTSMLKRSLKNSGVASSRSSSLAMMPLT